MAVGYFEALKRAKEHESAGESDEVLAYNRVAENCRKRLAKYGFVPEIVNGAAKAVHR